VACTPWQGGFGVTEEGARKRAAALDLKIDRDVTEHLHGAARQVFIDIRAYLIRRSDEMDTRNSPIQLLKLHQEKGTAVILLGPTFDKGPSPQHFNFDSGARLSFGLTLRERGDNSEVVSFRFHFQLPEDHRPEYFRFDLNGVSHEDPLFEPRCHLHPGLEEVRIPILLTNPVEILDRIFFVIETGVGAATQLPGSVSDEA
jgi:hypothetical protein